MDKNVGLCLYMTQTTMMDTVKTPQIGDRMIGEKILQEQKTPIK